MLRVGSRGALTSSFFLPALSSCSLIWPSMRLLLSVVL
jgi:hypothetical protein